MHTSVCEISCSESTLRLCRPDRWFEVSAPTPLVHCAHEQKKVVRYTIEFLAFSLVICDGQKAKNRICELPGFQTASESFNSPNPLQVCVVLQSSSLPNVRCLIPRQKGVCVLSIYATKRVRRGVIMTLRSRLTKSSAAMRVGGCPRTSRALYACVLACVLLYAGDRLLLGLVSGTGIRTVGVTPQQRTNRCDRESRESSLEGVRSPGCR